MYLFICNLFSRLHIQDAISGLKFQKTKKGDDKNAN